MMETFLQILIKIPGQMFLWYFAGISIVCIALGWLWANADGSTRYVLPEMTRFPPFAIAALRGGTKSVIETALFNLWDRKLVTFTGEGFETVVESVRSEEELGAVEKEVYDFVKIPRNVRDIFKDKELQGSIEAQLEPSYREMEELHLVRTRKDRSRAFTAAIVMFLAMGGTGLAKLYFGIKYSHPVGYLTILLIISSIALFAIVNPWSSQTRLGRRYLKELEGHYGWLKEAIKQTSTPTVDPAFAIAIFGMGVLSASPFFDTFSMAFSATKAGGDGGWGNWNFGDWGGGDSGDGGGGCGGGCGGCG